MNRCEELRKQIRELTGSDDNSFKYTITYEGERLPAEIIVGDELHEGSVMAYNGKKVLIFSGCYPISIDHPLEYKKSDRKGE